VRYVTGHTRAAAWLRTRAVKTGVARRSVITGYTAPYAIFVHENMEMQHPVGQAKYLEQPARTMERELAALMTETYRRTRDLSEALLAGARAIQNAALVLTPIETGKLRESSFVAKE
jgi:hypothetical protein